MVGMNCPPWSSTNRATSPPTEPGGGPTRRRAAESAVSFADPPVVLRWITFVFSWLPSSSVSKIS